MTARQRTAMRTLPPRARRALGAILEDPVYGTGWIVAKCALAPWSAECVQLREHADLEAANFPEPLPPPPPPPPPEGYDPSIHSTAETADDIRAAQMAAWQKQLSEFFKTAARPAAAEETPAWHFWALLAAGGLALVLIARGSR